MRGRKRKQVSTAGAGGEVVIRVIGHGRIEVERADDVIAGFAGGLPPGTYPTGHFDQLRNEWRA